MSYMKRAYENDHPELFEGDQGEREDLRQRPQLRSLFSDEPVVTEGRLFFAGDDAELNDALDAYLSRTPEGE